MARGTYRAPCHVDYARQPNGRHIMSRTGELNNIMAFDHVIRIDADGTITDGPAGVYAPESFIVTDDDGQISAADETEYTASIERQGWTLEHGWTGQYGYHGPVMHASEYVGGALEDHIRETPGLWVVVTVECLPASADDEAETETAGWAIAYRTENAKIRRTDHVTTDPHTEDETPRPAVRP